MEKRLIWYRRVSHQGQIDGHGLQRQQDAFDSYYQSLPNRDSYKLEQVSDEGLSAFHGVNVSDKGGLGDILKRVASGNIAPGSILVCESQSRLSRLEAVEAMFIIRTLNEAGITIWSLMDNREITTNGDMGSILTLIEGIRNHAYSRDMSYRGKKFRNAQCKAVREDGTSTYGNVCPHWLKVTDNGFEPIPEHVATIQRIFKERFELKSMASIAAGLNADNIPLITSRNWKKKAAPTGWSQSTIKNLLANERVIGNLPPSERREGKRKQGYYGDPIIPLEHWLAAQESLAHRGKKAVRNEANPFAVRLFKSLIVCKHCGHKMDVNGARQAHSERSKPYQGSLICRGARDNSCMHGLNGTRTPALPMKLVEHSLTTSLFRNLKQRDITAGAQAAIARLQLEINETDESIKQNTSDLATVRNQTARAAILTMIDSLGDTLDKKRAELATLERKQQATTLDTLEGLDILSVDGRLEAQRVIAKNIALISIDTVTATADIKLRNSNVIEGFSLRSTDDFTSTMNDATNEEHHEEMALVIGDHLPAVYTASKPTYTEAVPHDFTGWPDPIEPDYPPTEQ